MRVQVGHRVAEDLVVRLRGPEVLLERTSHSQKLVPIAARLLVRKLGRLGDVAAPPDDDRVAGLAVVAGEVRVRAAAGEDPHAVVVLVGPALGAERTPGATSPLGPVLRPGSGHAWPPFIRAISGSIFQSLWSR